jgi:DNA-binding IscR family transcriptional regulator
VLRFVEPPKHGKPEPGDPFTDLWKRVDGAADALLDTTTFAELVRRWKESQTKYVANWEI